MRRLIAATALCMLVLTGVSLAADRTFVLDPMHSRIGFSVTHMVISHVKGAFREYDASFTLNDRNELTGAEAVVKVASIDTGVVRRDDDLRSPNFFDVKAFPKLKFVATEITHKGNDYTVKGKLTIRHTTKVVTLTGSLLGVITDPMGKTRAGFTARGTINRHDFGLNWNQMLETGGLIVGPEVTLELEIEGVEAIAE